MEEPINHAHGASAHAPPRRATLRVAAAASADVVLAAADVSRRYGSRTALQTVSLAVRAGELHALLGPNGAGKTTLLRILSGLLAPSAGTVAILGRSGSTAGRSSRGAVGLVPSGDRSFYLRISGLENLVFFGRLHGLRRNAARARAADVLELVGLADAASVAVGEYSHGMQKRLSVARALLTQPPVLLVDEATHDLDPAGARLVRELVAGVVRDGAAAVWATQRVDEIRGFADRVTVLRRGEACFQGSVPELLAHALTRMYVLRVARTAGEPPSGAALRAAVHGLGTIAPVPHDGGDHHLLSLADSAVLGDAIVRLASAGLTVLACREERPEVEDAFLQLTQAAP